MIGEKVAEAWVAQALGVPEAFPWQCALLERFLRHELPTSVDVPTGLGKTAVIAVWLVARAMGASVPRRLVYVVDRRAVVDQATDVAQQLRKFLESAPDLSQRLGLADNRRLPISTLRGQYADNREWLVDPSAPAIVIGTVDMVGSRLLFEGYGVSRKTRSFHAGMLGADTLLVLDEAHLVPAFERMVRAIAGGGREFGPRDASLVALLPAFHLLSLSATGSAETGAFRLTAKDHEHPIVRKRLDAKKRLVLRSAIDPDEVSLAEALAKEAWDLCEEGARPLRSVVFCNSRSDAQRVYEALEARITKAKKANVPVGEAPIALLVGERRVYERERVADWLKERGFIAGSDVRPEHACFLVATSAGEVGIDLDADHMVSDLVAWERMVQRLGRVNRRGDGDAQVIVLPCLPNKKERAAFEKTAEGRSEEERNLVLRRHTLEAAKRVLERLPRGVEGDHDASPGAVVALKGRAADEAQLREELTRATTPMPLCPALSRAVVESWSMTSLNEHTGRPDVQPWLRGWVDDEPQTQIVWREFLPVNSGRDALEVKDVEDFFEAATPHVSETLEVETSRVLPWFTKRVEALFKNDSNSPDRTDVQEEDDGEGGEAVPRSVEDVAETGAANAEAETGELVVRPLRKLYKREVIAFVLPREGKPYGVTAWSLLGKDRARKRQLNVMERDLKGGRLVVLDRVGGLEEGLLNERSDAGEDVVRKGARLPFHVRVLAVSTGENSTVPVDDSKDSEAERWRKELELTIEHDEDEAPKRLLVVWSDLMQLAATEDARSVGPAQLLEEHQEWAEAQAERIGESLDLPERYRHMLKIAARLHDEGKSTERWQRAFKAKSGGPWGKTESRPNQHLLDGYRHEFGSLLMVEQHESLRGLDADLRDLCLHLITAHHGYARPSIRTNGCEKLPPSALQEKAQEVALRFTRLEQRWGPWGLAWWETLLRAADQEASRLNDARGKGARRG